MLDNEGWSLYGAQRSQLVATGGKWEGAENGSDKRKPLPAGCDQLPETFHAKEGVDGSSPSEGLTKGQQMALSRRCLSYLGTYE